ncbi:response regulator transcription factor [Piscirickettsia litoralis]|uniref:DNA-binding response regulator n=1 Tax=Piscirickettsia litoralis TaxID=1891921 RepID=A0ABX3A4A9_9GAMM|nr:response regulator transcription factor [Piscirickettsia litoralis]ODN43696.1 DNA-binding response regulator [Piscirickettsia litoralis]
MSKNANVLLIDDDLELCELLVRYLTVEEFNVKAVHHGDEALTQLQAQHYDVAVLDVMLPGQSGFDVLKEMRKQQIETPVLMLTARGEEVDRIVGLELGADDYLPKPCNPRELVARLRAVLRRTTAKPVDQNKDEDKLTVGELELDAASCSVFCLGEKVTVTATEYRILEILLRSCGRVVSKDALSKQVLGRPIEVFDRSLDVHLSNLRKKLSNAGLNDARITTVRGMGYRCDVVNS